MWYFFLKEAPPKVEPLPTQETELPEPVESAPEPPATDTSVSFTELKTSEDQIADIQLNIQDPTTFSIIELSAIDGVYTYQIAYDDVVQVIQSQDPDMDERLTQMANDAIEENKQRQAPAKTTTQTKTTNIKPAPKPATKPPVEKKEAAPVKQPPAQTKKYRTGSGTFIRSASSACTGSRLDIRTKRTASCIFCFIDNTFLSQEH